jgi:anaerobic magnesium-protoporphyrin IX monomethyl ester cyclase
MVTLISIYENRLFFEDLGIGRIESYLREKGVRVITRYLKCGEDIPRDVWDSFLASEYVGFSVYDSNIDFTEKIAASIKVERENIIIVYGSQYASIVYDAIFEMGSHADLIVLGDGEPTFIELIEARKRGIPVEEIARDSAYLASYGSRVNKKCRSADIVELPWPTHHGEYYRNNLHIDLSTSSGCIGNCSFCGTFRRAWSGRSPASVYSHIEETKEMVYALRHSLPRMSQWST